MFKKDLDKCIEERTSKNEIVKRLTKSYGISTKEFHSRVRSIYGKPLSELLVPTKEVFIDHLIRSNCIEDFKESLGISVGLGKLYEKYLGASTYSKAKLKVFEYKSVLPINPTREDNFAVLVSQKLGDVYGLL